MPNFEVFSGKWRKMRNVGPMIRLERWGRIGLNPQAVALLGDPEAVDLLYARDERAIGIRAADPARPHAYRVRTAKGAASKVISGAAYLKHYGITVGGLMHLPAELDGDTLIGYLP
jgi:hypothetical protein